MGLIIILGIIVYILWLTCFRYFYFVIKYQKNKTGTFAKTDGKARSNRFS